MSYPHLWENFAPTSSRRGPLGRTHRSPGPGGHAPLAIGAGNSANLELDLTRNRWRAPASSLSAGDRRRVHQGHARDQVASPTVQQAPGRPALGHQVVRGSRSSSTSRVPPARPPDGLADDLADSTYSEPQTEPVRAVASRDETPLNPRYAPSDTVSWADNRFWHAAAMAVRRPNMPGPKPAVHAR